MIDFQHSGLKHEATPMDIILKICSRGLHYIRAVVGSAKPQDVFSHNDRKSHLQCDGFHITQRLSSCLIVQGYRLVGESVCVSWSCNEVCVTCCLSQVLIEGSDRS